MKKEDKEKEKIKEELKEEVKSFFQNSLFDESNLGEDKNIKDIETQKIILNEIFTLENLKSTTQLNDDEIEDIENAYMLNHIFRNPLINDVCISHLQLKRSLTKEPKSLIESLFRWSENINVDSSINPIKRILGQKGSR